MLSCLKQVWSDEHQLVVVDLHLYIEFRHQHLSKVDNDKGVVK